jgi:ankyrin repeat domain-containing protein 50
LDPDTDNEVNYDILRFIDVKVDELSSTFSQCPESLCVHVRDVFRNRAQGTFLWVGLAAKALKECKATEIVQALDQFPPGLDKLYARLLLQINVKRRETAAKILRWVVMAIRPLTLSELSAAVEIAIRPTFDFRLVDVIRDQVLCCGHLLIIKEGKEGKEGNADQEDEVDLVH